MEMDRPRWPGFDVLRIFCAFAVVWIHGCDTSVTARRLSGYAGFAVPAFIMMSFFLLRNSCLQRDRIPWIEVLSKRLHRLLPAYLAWSCAYLTVRSVKHAAVEPTMDLKEWIYALFSGGASYQLYFVVAVISWTVLFLPLLLSKSRRPVSYAAGLVLLGSLMLWAGPAVAVRIGAEPYMFPWRQMIGLSGYVPLAIGFAGFWNAFGHKLLPGGNPGCLAASLSLLLGIAWFFLKIPAGIPAVPSILFIAASLLAPWKHLPAGLLRLSGLSYGIFLVHGFFVEGFQMLCLKTGVDLGKFSSTLVLILLSYFFSYMTCELIARIKPLRWLVL